MKNIKVKLIMTLFSAMCLIPALSQAEIHVTVLKGSGPNPFYPEGRDGPNIISVGGKTLHSCPDHEGATMWNTRDGGTYIDASRKFCTPHWEK